ncbi:MAG TPA: PAS domain-containing protein [Gemmatimonadaceae bacterium]|nr:PAS domain-containing protein [Gemmatimonadaceae bacterium]
MTERADRPEPEAAPGVAPTPPLADDLPALRRRVAALEAADAERRRALATLRHHAESRRLALEAARLGTWDWDVASDRVVWSSMMERLFGIPIGSFGGTVECFRERVHPDDRAAVSDAVRRALARRSEYSIEFRIVRPDGSVRWMTAQGCAFYGENGRPIHMTGIAMDVTARRRVDEERLALERHLLATQKLESLAVLAGGVAHDFQNFLTIIRANAQLAARELSAEAAGMEWLAAVQDAVQNAAALTRELLAYIGEEPAQLAPHALNERVAEIATLLHASLPRDVALVQELPPGLPTVAIDVAQLRRVLVNLVLNAAEAIGARGGTVTLRTGRRRLDASTLAGAIVGADLPPGEYVVVEVADNGPGIEPHLLARVFDPFFTTKDLGHGLGLAVVVGVARAHRAALTVTSTPRVGTRFTLYFAPYRGVDHQR